MAFKVCHFDLPSLRYVPEMAKKYRKIEGRFTVLPVVQSNEIKRICKFASRFSRFNLDLEGILRIFQE